MKSIFFLFLLCYLFVPLTFLNHHIRPVLSKCGSRSFSFYTHIRIITTAQCKAKTKSYNMEYFERKSSQIYVSGNYSK